MRILALALLLAAPATAQDTTLPRLHNVTDTAADDRLNIRAEPSGNAPILGSLAHDATGIEVLRLSDDTNWGRIETEAGPGWVFMRYLEADPSPDRVTDGLICGGIKPDWSLRLDPFSDYTGDLAITDWLEAEEAIHINWGTTSQNHPGMAELYEYEVHPGLLTFALIPGQCNDGLSSREYGLRLLGTYFSNDDEGSSVTLEGCCTQQLTDP